MIDKHEFGAGMAVLAGAFGREIDEPIIRAYYAVLGSRLTTAEWQLAVSHTLSGETFWPSPAVLLQKVKADDESKGVAVLEHVRRVLWKAGGHRFLPFETFQQEFDAPTKAAIRDVGGLAAISDDDSRAFAKRFVKAYAEAVNPSAPRISQPPTDGKVIRLVRDVAANISRRDRQLPTGDA